MLPEFVLPTKRCSPAPLERKFEESSKSVLSAEGSIVAEPGTGGSSVAVG